VELTITLPKKNKNSFESNLNAIKNLFYCGRILEPIFKTSTFPFGHLYIALTLLP
jgi:hypothetical protein